MLEKNGKKEHTTRMEDQNTLEIYQCAQCEKHFTNERGRRAHIGVAHREEDASVSSGAIIAAGIVLGAALMWKLLQKQNGSGILAK